MSFSGNLKNELAGIIPGVKAQAAAEIGAILDLPEEKSQNGREEPIFFCTEILLLAKKVFTICKKYYNINVGASVSLNRKKDRRTYTLEICQNIPGMNSCGIKSSAVFFAFLRGMFLVHGSISDPSRSYHMEFVMQDRKKAEQLRQLIAVHLGDGAKLTKRGESHILYIKDSSLISDVLAAMGANIAMMEFENARALGETRGKVNRMVNCEVGNLRKSAEAGEKQINCIRLIQEKMGLDSLPEELREVAALRLKNPEASLQEIGEMMNPCLGRSGVNHRLHKLLGIAEELTKSQEEM